MFDMLFFILILMLLSVLPIYSFVKMIRSFRKAKDTARSEVAIASGNIFEAFILMGFSFPFYYVISLIIQA